MKAKLCLFTSAVLMLFTISRVAAQDFNWSGAGDGTSWGDPNNWVQMIVPTNGVHAIFIGTGYPTPSTHPITIGPTDVVQITDSLFGPEWGQTLNVNGGQVTLGFGFFPLGDSFTGKSTINVRSNATFTALDTISLGDTWWFPGGPNVSLNVYDTSLVTANYLWVGGHLNLYGGTVMITNFMGAGTVSGPVFTGGIDSDATRRINLVDGKLILPTGSTGAIQDWIARGIFQPYGKPYDTNDVVITDDGVNTIATNVPLGGSLQGVFIKPLNPSTLTAGTYQQAQLLGNYPNVTNVLVSTTEPGVNPASLPGTCVFTSDNTNIFTVTVDGVIHAVSPGSATLHATLGSYTDSAVVTVKAATTTLIHRYSFNESSGTTASDSIGGSAWNGTLTGSAAFSGSGDLVLDGTQGSAVQLPAGIVSNMDSITIEAWATFPSTLDSNAVLFAFGDTDRTAFDPNYGMGQNYVMLSPHTGATNVQANFGIGLPGNANEHDAILAGQVLDNRTNVHIVAVFNPMAGYETLYINGVSVASYNNLGYFLLLENSMPSPLADVLGADPLNFIGQSLYDADPGLLANINEFRIYNGALSGGQVQADYALGPNQTIGTNTHVSLSTSMSAGALSVSWPTNSALVTLMSSPVLGSNAVWTPVNGGLAVLNGMFTVSVSPTNSAQYFRLQ